MRSILRNSLAAALTAGLVLAIGPACKKKEKKSTGDKDDKAPPAMKVEKAKAMSPAPTTTKTTTKTTTAKKKEVDEALEKQVGKLSVKDLAGLMANKDPLTVCDANRKAVREKYGVIPGSVLLTSYKEFDPAKTLGDNKGKKVVFYCSNEFCRASDKAAVRALSAGYKNVAVLRAGIKGWKNAGQKTKTIPKS